MKAARNILESTWKNLCGDYSSTSCVESIDSSFASFGEVLEVSDGLELDDRSPTGGTDADDDLDLIENLQNLNFVMGEDAQEPTDLFSRADDSTTTRVKDEYGHLFDGPACRAFFAYIPLPYWIQVVEASNRGTNVDTGST